ncbi:MAG: AbgT family transporter [Bacteroidales bacterium]|nr:AbgT family transporter [Bacteroidales bacterium]MCF8406099.1 AbgT family transporter [Bacteroidales bacterium]
MFKKIPHTYVIIFYAIVFAAVLTWIIPGGEFERKVINSGGVERTVIDKDSFHYIESNSQTWQVFSGLFNGFVRQSGIVILILMIGGGFWIMNASKSIDVGIFAFLKFTKGLEHLKFFKVVGVNNVIIVLVMVLFSIFGAVFGMSEETIAFIIIVVPLAISMGYDSIVGVCMVYVAAHMGFAAAVLNPFTIGIAQGIANLPLFSGLEFRIFCWFVINFVGISFVLWYAKRVKDKPERSPMYKLDEYWRQRGNAEIENMEYHTPKITWAVFGFITLCLLWFSFQFPMSDLKIGNVVKTIPAVPIATGLFAIMSIPALLKSVHYFVLNLLAFTIVFLVIGVMGYGWYLMEIASLFFVMGILSGAAMNYNANHITKLFIDGSKDILSAALVVGLAGGILVILEDGKIIDTILYSISNSMQGMGKIGSISVMYGIQTFINIIIPSGSAKAALTMPVMAPFSDLVGISRQATVMAFQFGDGFTNMITPTSPVLIGALGIAKIPYDKWVRWVLPLIGILIVLGWLLLLPTVLMELNGF